MMFSEGRERCIGNEWVKHVRHVDNTFIANVLLQALNQMLPILWSLKNAYSHIVAANILNRLTTSTYEQFCLVN